MGKGMLNDMTDLILIVKELEAMQTEPTEEKRCHKNKMPCSQRFHFLCAAIIRVYIYTLFFSILLFILGHVLE